MKKYILSAILILSIMLLVACARSLGPSDSVVDDFVEMIKGQVIIIGSDSDVFYDKCKPSTHFVLKEESGARIVKDGFGPFSTMAYIGRNKVILFHLEDGALIGAEYLVGSVGSRYEWLLVDRERMGKYIELNHERVSP